MATAYGFGIKKRPGRTWVGHNGGTLGANAEFEFSSDGEWTVIVLSNRDPPSATNLLEYLEDVIVDPVKTSECAGRAAPR